MSNLIRVTLIALMLSAASCSFTNMGRDLGSGLSEGLGPQLDSIGANLGGGLIRGVRDTLTSARTRDSLSNFIDSIITSAGLSANKSVSALRDTLMGPYTRQWLLSLEKDMTADLVLAAAGISENLLGQQTLKRVAALRDTLLGRRTMSFISALRDTVLGPRLREEVGLLRDDLLGQKTRDAIDSILVSATSQLQSATHEEESFLKKNIAQILWTAGGILAGLLIVGGIVVARVRSYRKMIETVAVQIHKMPDTSAYDELTSRIQTKTQEHGIEKSFRQILEKHGLKGEGSWKSS